MTAVSSRFDFCMTMVASNGGAGLQPAGLEGFDTAKHLHFNESSLVITATLRGQGAALSGPPYVGSALGSGRLNRVGKTILINGEYWLLESNDLLGSPARAAFIEWLNLEAKDLFRTRMK